MGRRRPHPRVSQIRRHDYAVDPAPCSLAQRARDARPPLGREDRHARGPGVVDPVRNGCAHAARRRRDPAVEATLPEFVVPLAGAYVIAASEWLDFEGAASPSALLSAEQEAQRTAHIEIGADRAFILTAALPVEPHEQVAALYRTLLLGRTRRSSATSRPSFATGCARTTPPCSSRREGRGERWDIVLLRRVVELWTHVLRGAGPSGLEHAMEIIASIREERPIREAAQLATIDTADETRTALLPLHAVPSHRSGHRAAALPPARRAVARRRAALQPLHPRARRRRRRSAPRCQLRLALRGRSRASSSCAPRSSSCCPKELVERSLIIAGIRRVLPTSMRWPFGDRATTTDTLVPGRGWRV